MNQPWKMIKARLVVNYAAANSRTEVSVTFLQASIVEWRKKIKCNLVLLSTSQRHRHGWTTATKCKHRGLFLLHLVELARSPESLWVALQRPGESPAVLIMPILYLGSHIVGTHIDASVYKLRECSLLTVPWPCTSFTQCYNSERYRCLCRPCTNGYASFN